MSQETLDWLADDEGNLRPEAVEALAAEAPGPALRADLPSELSPVGRILGRGLLIAAGLWLVVVLLKWLLLGLFLVGVALRLRDWSAAQDASAPPAATRARRTVRIPVEPRMEAIPQARRGEDTDPALGVEAGAR